MHQDTKYDIRKCDRTPARYELLPDLTRHKDWAEKAIMVADQFFFFDLDQVQFSGLVSLDFHERSLMVEVWNESDLVYEVKFENVGVQGILYVDMQNVRQSPDQGMFGPIRIALREDRNVIPNGPGFRWMMVNDLDLTVAIESCPQ